MQLKFENLNVIIDEKQILYNIELIITLGRTTCIVGKSGAGKSTLLRAMVSLVDYSGKISMADRAISEMPVTQLRKILCYVPQIPSSFPGSCYENIAWPRSCWNLETTPDIAQKFLNLVGLNSKFLHSSASKLSVGQLQKLSFARALAIEPKILLLDEPASALDAISKENFENIIQNIIGAYKAITVIMVTHDIQQASRVADEVILLDQGKIILQNDVNAFFKTLDTQSDADFLKNVLFNGES